ncbi:MAG TPA: hypothetical protein VG897_17125 [Terriglobales bacterium]|nr:hypothetical protein [Terriglobales bacterium]
MGSETDRKYNNRQRERGAILTIELPGSGILPHAAVNHPLNRDKSQNVAQGLITPTAGCERIDREDVVRRTPGPTSPLSPFIGRPRC